MINKIDYKTKDNHNKRIEESNNMKYYKVYST